FQEDLPDLVTVRPHLPEALTHVLRTGTALNPHLRPESVMALMNEMERVLAPKPVAAPSAIPGDMTIPQHDEETGETARGTVDLSDVMPLLSPDEMAKQEAIDLYTRARKAWAHGQGRFLMGV